MKLTDKLGGKLMILRGEKNCLKKLCSAFAVLLALLTLALPVHTVFGADNIPAFPGAEGGGKYTLGARGVSSPKMCIRDRGNTNPKPYPESEP